MERADVQGLILFAYKHHPSSCFFLVRFEQGDAREWLRRVLPDVSSGAEQKDARYHFNVAFSARGLSALGLAEDLASFSREFNQGMAHPERSNVLGDQHSDDPKHWEFGNAENPVDAVAMLYARTPADLQLRATEVERQLHKFKLGFKREEVELAADGTEHFGFQAGASQPNVRGSGRRRKSGEPKLATGEFVLGYPNAHGVREPVPTARRRPGTREHPLPILGTDQVAFGQNGSYLVVRKLGQDPAAFWRYAWELALAEQAADPALRAKFHAARLVGRWPNGVSLVEAPGAEREAGLDPNDFKYREPDPAGLRCPLGAHVRRANPRDALGESGKEGLREANLHRILRRGRVYGPKLKGGFPPTDDGQARGLFFLALNAQLTRQFEFIQQSRLNACKFAGLSDERDPLVGKEVRGPDGDRAPRSFTAQALPVRWKSQQLSKFVRVRGGEYFFLPGLRALNFLCDGGG